MVVKFELWKSPVTDRVEHQNLAHALCEEHPAISVDRRIFGGIPHLRGLRLSVGDILGQIYVSGSIEGVKKIYLNYNLELSHELSSRDTHIQEVAHAAVTRGIHREV